MKALALGGLILVVCAMLFVVGVFSPRRSRRMQRSVERLARKGERKADPNDGRFAAATRKGLRAARKAAAKSAKKGRDVHDRVVK